MKSDMELTDGQPKTVSVASEMNSAEESRHIKYLIKIIGLHGVPFYPIYTDGKISISVPEEILLGEAVTLIEEYCNNGQMLTVKLKGNPLFKEIHQDTLLIYQDRKVTVIGKMNHVGRFFSKIIRPIKKEKKKDNGNTSGANLRVPTTEHLSRIGV